MLRYITIAALLALLVFLHLTTGASAQGPRDPMEGRLMMPEFDREVMRLKKALHNTTPALDTRDMNAMDPELRRYLKAERERSELKLMVSDAVEEGCRGECLREVLATMNRAADRGVEDWRAREMVTEALRKETLERETGMDSGGVTLGTAVRLRVEENLREEDREIIRHGPDAPGGGRPIPGGRPAPVERGR